MGRAFEPLAPPAAQVTLSWVRELQRIEVALENNLNQDPDDAVHAGLIETMQTRMVDYSSFVKVRKSLSIFTNYGRRRSAQFISSLWMH